MIDYLSARPRITERLAERAPGRIQILSGPRQIGKTSLLLNLRGRLKDRCLYAAADAPEAALPGWWESLWADAESAARKRPGSVLMIDEVQAVPRWSFELKSRWDRLKREHIPLHVIVTGSSSLRLGADARESMAGRFERLDIGHWSARAYAKAFNVGRSSALKLFVTHGTYPGGREYLRDFERWRAYLRDAVIEPAISRDINLLKPVRRPALLRRVFGAAVSVPAQIVSLQKLRMDLEDGSLDTVADYLELLHDALLVAPLEKHSKQLIRRRSAPPKIVLLSNALIAAADPGGPPDPKRDPDRWGAWVENACLAHAINSGQSVRYWREEPLEVDGIIEGDWGRWAIEIKTGKISSGDFRGALEFVRRYPAYRALAVVDAAQLAVPRRIGLAAISWEDYLWSGPPAS